MAGNGAWRSVLLLLFITDVWAVVGPDDRVSSSSGRIRELPESCPVNCFCSGHDTRCDQWPSSPQQGIEDYKNLVLPRRTRILSFKFLPNTRIDGDIFRQFDELQWLQIQNGNLTEFPDFPVLDTLSYLDLSINKIRFLPPQAFRNTPHIVYLNISSNDLTNLSSNALEGLNDLKQLDLSSNPSILQLSSNFFSNTRSINLLDISAINLDTFWEQWAEELQELHTLNLSYNNIVNLPHVSSKNLKILDLSNTPLNTMPILAGFPALTELYLPNTLISYIKASETEGCNNLQILDLRNTNLTNLNEGVLGNCINLLKIDLSDNLYLWRIEHGAFSNLKGLTTLRLNDCPNLYDVEEEAFNDLDNLQELYLQNSGIKVFPYSLTKLVNLTLLNIENTSLFCDCYAHWLPNYLISNRNKKWKGIERIQCNDGIVRSPEEIAINIEKLECSAVISYTKSNQWVIAHSGQSAMLECNVTGNPRPKIIWQTADNHLHVYNKTMDLSPWMGHQITEAITVAKAESEAKYQVLRSGQLLIKNIRRKDIGRYRCFAFNPVSNSSVVTFVGLNASKFRSLIIQSILFGFFCAALFLLTTLIVQFIRYTMNRLGWECCCCKNRISPKAKQIRQLIESVESYKSAQLEKLRENYTSQVTNIKESCYLQMERLRDSYAQQSKNLKDLCDYSTQQITGARDQYLDQVNKIRDYSLGQMNRVRENYVFQRNRIRKFSGHQLLRLRETYKYQQKTLNKLLETLPDLYIQNCRTGSCQRTDSIIFDGIDGLDVYYKIDFLDTQSCSSDYFTPNSTLTRHYKSGKSTHSRDQSTTSGGTDYQDVHSQLTQQESNGSEKLKDNPKHSRSLSIGTPQSLLQRLESARSHKRSVSVSSQPSPSLFHPKPPLVEENLDTLSRASASTNSKGTSLYTPLASTPVHSAQFPITDTNCTQDEDNQSNNLNRDQSESEDNKKTAVQNKTNCDSKSDLEMKCDSDMCKITMESYETNL